LPLVDAAGGPYPGIVRRFSIINMVYKIFRFNYIYNMKQKVFTKPLVREDIDIEKIAGILGLEYKLDGDGYKCITIGDADWDNTGNEMTLVLKYKCGPYNSEWKRTGINEDELFIMIKQTVNTLSLTGIINFEQAFTFIAGLLLIKQNIGSWRTNYMAANHNKEIEKTLSWLD
jgi:hypothetical protein